jgi:inward rectifier potassium channel
MALMKRINSRLKAEDNSGFGTNSNYSGGRFYNRTGNPNVIKRGVGIFDRYSWYHTMLAMPRGKFLSLLFIIYILINILFAGIYYLIGIQHLSGVNSGGSMKNFTEVFFFSTQTFTTVGYGRISPTGFLTSAVATFEAFLGLLSFAIATGLFYGRFSRPQAFIKFSNNAVIAPYKNGIAFMFRLAPYKNNNLSEGEVKLTLAMRIEENGQMVNKFYGLDLEISKVNAITLSWTLVHAINESSPLYNLTLQDLIAARAEILVFIKGFDEVFANTVVSRTSYVAEEIVWGAKFKIMYHSSDNKEHTIIDIDRINEYELIDLPHPVMKDVNVSG